MTDVTGLVQDIYKYKTCCIALSCESEEDADIIDDLIESSEILSRVGRVRDLLKCAKEISDFKGGVHVCPIGLRLYLPVLGGKPRISSWSTDVCYYKDNGYKIIKVSDYIVDELKAESDADISELI